jgi:hypothetical protein
MQSGQKCPGSPLIPPKADVGLPREAFGEIFGRAEWISVAAAGTSQGVNPNIISAKLW